jgi:hypothetical protein
MFRFRSIKQEYLHIYEESQNSETNVGQSTLDSAQVLIELPQQDNGNNNSSIDQ